MRINRIIIELNPYYQPHQIELHCELSVDGRKLHWQEIFPDTDFESRAEQYFDHMKHRIIEAMKKEAKEEKG